MEIDLYQKLQDPISAIERLGTMFAKSGMFGCDRAEQGQVLAMICLAEKKSPVAINRDYDIVEGKLRKKALAALADFRAAGGKHTWLKSGDTPAATEEERKAVLELTPTDGPKLVYEYSMADARAEGLIRDKSRWTKRPGNMLRARCITNALGMVCPEIFAGDEPMESSSPNGATINLEPATVTTAAPAAPVIEVQAVKTSASEDEKIEADMGLAPQVMTPKPQAPLFREVQKETPPAPVKDFAKGPDYASPRGTQLGDDTVAQIEQAIGDKGPVAVAWMLKEGWLQPGQGLKSLTESRAKRIIKQRDSFLRAIGGQS